MHALTVAITLKIVSYGAVANAARSGSDQLRRATCDSVARLTVYCGVLVNPVSLRRNDLPNCPVCLDKVERVRLFPEYVTSSPDGVFVGATFVPGTRVERTKVSEIMVFYPCEHDAIVGTEQGQNWVREDNA